MSNEKKCEIGPLTFLITHWYNDTTDLDIEGSFGGCYCCTSEDISVGVSVEQAEELVEHLQGFIDKSKEQLKEKEK